MSDGDDGDREGATGDDAGAPTGDDPERARLLRETAEDIRARGDDRSEQVAAFLYRVSDLYDPEEERTPAGIYRNMRNILQVRERGTLARDRDRDGDGNGGDRGGDD